MKKIYFLFVAVVMAVMLSVSVSALDETGQCSGNGDHNYTSKITTQATCVKKGVKTYTCTCGDSYTEAIPKKDHEYDTWWVKTKPTCTKAGLEWTYCHNCDNDIEREIPATGHTVIEYVMRATTDEHAAYGGDGAYVTACDVCCEVFKQDFFARPAEYKLSTSE